MNHINRERRAIGQSIRHHATDGGNHHRIKYSPGSYRFEDFAQTVLTPLDIDIGIIGNEANRTIDFFHHVIAGINAEATLNAAKR